MSKNYTNIQKLDNITGSIDDNSDVDLLGLVDGQFLRYSVASGAWLPSSSGDFLSLSVNSTGVSVVGHNHNITDIDGSGNLVLDGHVSAITGIFDKLILNTSLEDPTLTVGELAWNPTEGTIDLGLSDNYAVHVGEELHYRVRNNTGSTLLAGTAVYATGLTPGGNNRLEVAPKAADGSIREIRFMGLMTADCDTGLNGYTTHFGYIRGIDTRGDATSNGTTDKLWASGEPAWNEGDILYVHPTVPGKLTKTEPKHSISVAIILNCHENQGKIFVRPTTYGHLSDNHDVDISGATNGQFLQYNSVTDYWVPSSSGNFTVLQVNGTGVSITGHTHTNLDISDFNTAVSGLLPVKNIIAGTDINITSSSGIFTINSTATGGGSTTDQIHPFLLGGM